MTSSRTFSRDGPLFARGTVATFAPPTSSLKKTINDDPSNPDDPYAGLSVITILRDVCFSL